MQQKHSSSYSFLKRPVCLAEALCATAGVQENAAGCSERNRKLINFFSDAIGCLSVSEYEHNELHNLTLHKGPCYLVTLHSAAAHPWAVSPHHWIWSECSLNVHLNN